MKTTIIEVNRVIDNCKRLYKAPDLGFVTGTLVLVDYQCTDGSNTTLGFITRCGVDPNGHEITHSVRGLIEANVRSIQYQSDGDCVPADGNSDGFSEDTEQ